MQTNREYLCVLKVRYVGISILIQLGSIHVYSLVVTAVKAYKARAIVLQEVHCIPMCR